MQDRVARILLLLLLIAVGAYVAQPYIMARLYSANEPRTVDARGNLAESERSTIALFERVSPSVVHIAARPANMGSMLRGEEGGGAGQSGTGFVWDAAGHVVTNNHVVQNAASVAVRLANGDVVDATVVGLAPNYDLAVLRLGRTHAIPAPIAVGSSGDLKVGQAAFAIGNPFGLDQTLTTGVVSALKRRLPTSGGREIADVIQTDAAINPGNSGGPLLDSSGRLIGVNTAIFSPSGTNAGIGFAIPVDVVNRVVPQLIKDGRVPTPGIGIIVADETVTARAGLQGVLIVRTVPNSSAERAGLRGIDQLTGAMGDVIVSANGKPVRRLTDLTSVLEAAGIGQRVELGIRRSGRDQTVQAEVMDVSRNAP